MKTLFQMGVEAHAKGITAPAYDPALMEWLKLNTTGEVGSAIPHIKKWLKGFNSAVDAECYKILNS